MLCPHCNAFVPDDAPLCPKCGMQFHKKRGSLRPLREYHDYLGWSIALTVLSAFCCTNLFGIVTGALGIVFSALAKSALERNDYEQAVSKSGLARILLIVTTCLIAGSFLLMLFGPTLVQLLIPLFERLFELLEPLHKLLPHA